jgi:hypothetical protein
VPDPLIAVPGHAVAPTVLAVLIATVTALIAGLGLLGLIVDKHLAERLRRSEDHLARAQRIAHTGSIEQDLRTGAIESFGETYRIFASGKLSSLSFIPTIAPRLNRKRLLTKPTRGGGFLTCSALPSGFASSSLGAR